MNILLLTLTSIDMPFITCVNTVDQDQHAHLYSMIWIIYVVCIVHLYLAMLHSVLWNSCCKSMLFRLQFLVSALPHDAKQVWDIALNS